MYTGNIVCRYVSIILISTVKLSTVCDMFNNNQPSSRSGPRWQAERACNVCLIKLIIIMIMIISIMHT